MSLTAVWVFPSQVFPGVPATPKRPLAEYDPAVLPSITPISHREAIHLLSQRHVFNDHLFSMQQSSFSSAGFEVNSGTVVLPEEVDLVIGLSCADRYNIFAGHMTVVSFQTLDAWRMSEEHYPFPEARNSWRREFASRPHALTVTGAQV